MVDFLSNFWNTGKKISKKAGSKQTTIKNMSVIIIPISFLFLLLAVVSLFLYVLYASYFSEKLNEDENIEKLYNSKENILEEGQLSMIRYFENYRICSDAAIILLLFIIALSCMYLVLKMK